MRLPSKRVFLIFLGTCAAGFLLTAALLGRSCADDICVNEEGIGINKNLDWLAQKTGSQADTSRIADGVLPPTNSWISGAVLQKEPYPVFPTPLSFKLSDNGYELGLPDPKSQNGVIVTAPHLPVVSVAVPSAAQVKLTRFDKISATLTYYDQNGTELGALTIAEGSPYSFYKAVSNHSADISATGKINEEDRSYHSVQAAQGKFGIAISGGYFDDSRTANLTSGSIMSIFAIGSADGAALKAKAFDVISHVDISYESDGDNIETILSYMTESGEASLVGRPDYGGTDGGHFQTLYGPFSLKETSELSFSAPYISPSAELDIRGLSSDRKSILRAQLSKDVSSTKIDALDTYFSGKQLSRAANLLSIAEQLDEQAAASNLKSLMNQAFSSYLDDHAFYYDSQIKGVAAENKAFGSEDFNDHHFHYGYYLYAASILAHYDAEFIGKFQGKLDTLAADIAQPKPDSTLPQTRNYDPYKGHSWAAGLSPFADGNNQESSSEALNAWNAVALWGQATKNDALVRTGEALLANEASTARSLWREPRLRGYSQPMIALNWGAKREYATFFSDQPTAKLGIQLIPMSPVFVSALDGDEVDGLINKVLPDKAYNAPLGDYVLMYQALMNTNRAIELMPGMKDEFIDSGNSRTYMQAWAFSLTD